VGPTVVGLTTSHHYRKMHEFEPHSQQFTFGVFMLPFWVGSGKGEGEQRGGCGCKEVVFGSWDWGEMGERRRLSGRVWWGLDRLSVGIERKVGGVGVLFVML
jgi:hypothetical protein